MANEGRIQGMREEFNELRQAISSDLDERFQAGARALREGLSKDLDERFAASEQRLTEKLTHVIVQQLDTAQQHLEGRLQVHMEDLKGLVTTTTEAYGRVLANHNERLAALEPQQRF